MVRTDYNNICKAFIQDLAWKKSLMKLDISVISILLENMIAIC